MNVNNVTSTKSQFIAEVIKDGKSYIITSQNSADMLKQIRKSQSPENVQNKITSPLRPDLAKFRLKGNKFQKFVGVSANNSSSANNKT